MKKNILKIVALLVLGLVLYNSFYFEKLSTRKVVAGQKIDFDEVATSLYQNILKLEPVKLEVLQAEISQSPESALKKYGNRLGIGSSAYVMTSFTGKIKAKSESELIVSSTDGHDYKIDLVYIFGNTIRDASKLVKLTDYKKTSEFNALSEALNAIIREKEIPKAVKTLKIGDAISAKVAFKLNKEKVNLSALNLIPINIIKQ